LPLSDVLFVQKCHELSTWLLVATTTTKHLKSIPLLFASLLGGVSACVASGSDDPDEGTIASAATVCGQIFPNMLSEGYAGPRSATSTETYFISPQCSAKNTSNQYVAGAASAINSEYWAGYATAIDIAIYLANCPTSCPADISLVHHNPDGVESVPVSAVTTSVQVTTDPGGANRYKCLYTADFHVHPVFRVECKVPPATGGGSGK
jgi:hypothetical protein